MKKTDTLSAKLKSYSLLAGSMVASSFVAQSQVIYTEVNPDKELGGAVPQSFPQNQEYLLDLNNDGVNDFSITMNIESINTPADGYNFAEKITGINNPSNAIRYYSNGDYVFFAQKINKGDSIPLNNYNWYFKVNFAFQYGASVEYKWDDIHDKYVALKFKEGANIHYGWIRVDVNIADTVPNIIIKDFAYEQTPDKKIAAGDTGVAVGIISPGMEDRITLSPNPSDGKCLIRFEKPLTGEANLSVKDATGREIYHQNIQSGQQQNQLALDFSDFASGIYFIELKSETVSVTEKWIKN